MKICGAKSKLILALGVEELVSARVIGFRDEDLAEAVQVAVVRRGGVHEILRGGDAVLFEHHHEHVGVDEGAGVKQFHAGDLTTASRAEASREGGEWTRIKT